jgi:hypothetical protein
VNRDIDEAQPLVGREILIASIYVVIIGGLDAARGCRQNCPRQCDDRPARRLLDSRQTRVERVGVLFEASRTSSSCVMAFDP